MRPRSVLALAVLLLFAGGPVGTALGQTRRPPPAKRPAVTKSLRKAPAKPLKKTPAGTPRLSSGKTLKSPSRKTLKQTFNQSSGAKPIAGKTAQTAKSRSLRAEFNSKARPSGKAGAAAQGHAAAPRQTVSGKAPGGRRPVSLEKRATAARALTRSKGTRRQDVQARLDQLRQRVQATPPRKIQAAWGASTYKNGGLMTGIEHIMYRHSARSGFANVSRFAERTSVHDIKQYVDDALRYGKVRRTGLNAFTVDHNLKRTIGTDTSGRPATSIRVYVRDGIIRSAFPI
jgi:hypothetical protein